MGQVAAGGDAGLFEYGLAVGGQGQQDHPAGAGGDVDRLQPAAGDQGGLEGVDLAAADIQIPASLNDPGFRMVQYIRQER